ncbi:uncharacterized protein SPAPADRAFT_70279 [Spathaspora passalidarum NRRL Y-27907]|uniref:Uncharacterized protein n=1 Tax=Spathaspora passalidarum (strain NRRL Y-27907 / 11-Y1) TaxID=619300 RepID=G3AHE3_SPAPN|nr:uncharacterized protein SPAPADRAFT_70279 [Spathaspora passalidarum NRRL Y-27907]EGW34108.1 hypothetical protein SPAPADRAFT_70279 [Spathaspora passalidarum NRRL Y-27907]
MEVPYMAYCLGGLLFRITSANHLTGLARTILGLEYKNLPFSSRDMILLRFAVDSALIPHQGKHQPKIIFRYFVVISKHKQKTCLSTDQIDYKYNYN